MNHVVSRMGARRLANTRTRVGSSLAHQDSCRRCCEVLSFDNAVGFLLFQVGARHRVQAIGVGEDGEIGVGEGDGEGAVGAVNAERVRWSRDLQRNDQSFGHAEATRERV